MCKKKRQKRFINAFLKALMSEFISKLNCKFSVTHNRNFLVEIDKNVKSVTKVFVQWWVAQRPGTTSYRKQETYLDH